jgi:ABC-2 type transport system permease protein
VRVSGLEREPAGEETAGTPAGRAVHSKRGPRIRFQIMTEAEEILSLKQGGICLFIKRPEDREGLRFYFDPRNGEAQTAYLVLERALGGGGGSRPRDEVVPLEVQGTRYIDFLVPGLLAMGVMSSALWGIGWALIEIRMKKLMRRMSATPMRKTMFLGSHFLARLIVNALEFMALFLFAYYYFGVKVQGSTLALAVVFVAGNIAFSGLAIFTSSRTNNPRVGNGLINALTFPMILLSGVFFSYRHFPAWAIPIVNKLPLTVLADSLRSVFNEGAGLEQIALPSLVLSASGLLFFYVGMKIYKWY